MSPPLPDRRPTTLPLFPASTERAYAELLRAHARSQARGQPLLTAAGVAYLRRLRTRARQDRKVRRPRRPLPRWEPQSRRLWLGHVLVKDFRQPAPYQTRLLDVFQEQGWRPQHSDDPLPRAAGEGEEEARRRLRETIKNLNRSLPAGTLRFRGDGTGQGVIWDYDEG